MAKAPAPVRAVRAARSLLDPRGLLHALKLLHYFGYTHYWERSKIEMGPGVKFPPNVSIVRGDLITIGAGSHIGARCHLWAGDQQARIEIGEHALFAPEVFITTTNYQTKPGIPVMDQPKDEASVKIGSMTWLGARVVVVAGVEIGDGCIVAAGSVVTKDLPPNTICAGVPAKVIGMRE